MRTFLRHMKKWVPVISMSTMFLGSAVKAEDRQAEEDPFKDLKDVSVNLFHGPPIPFRPLDISEFVNPRTGKPRKLTDMIVTTVNGEPVIMTGAKMLQAINDKEKMLNQLGETLRNPNLAVSKSLLANPEKLIRMNAKMLGMELKKSIELSLPPKEDCPVLKLQNLGTNPKTGRSYQDSDLIAVSGAPRIKLSNLLPKLNDQQAYLCSLGFSMLDNVLNTDDVLTAIFETRDELLARLGIDLDNPIFQYAAILQDLDPEKLKDRLKDAEAEMKQTLEQLKNPSPEFLYSVAKDYLPEVNKLLPQITPVPGVKVKQRTDLKLKKKFVWPGISGGEEEFVAYYAYGWAEIRGGQAGDESKETSDQSVQAEANGGVYIVKNQLNIAGATLDSYVTQSRAYANLKYCFLQHCTEKTKDTGEVGFSEGDPQLFYKDWKVSYSYPFSIGPIPCFIRVGGALVSQAGWMVTANLLSVKAEALGTLKAKAFGEAAIGVENFVEAGAGGEINIIDETISLGGQAGVRFAGNGAPVLDGAIIGRNTMTVLSGSIYGFALVDLTGPLGPLLDKILEGLQSLGVEFEGVMNQLSNFSEDARKWVESNLGGAGKSISKAASNLGKKIKKCCKFSGNGLQIEGLKVRYRQDWKTWPGWSDSRDFVNIKLFVGPDGKEQSGDLSVMDSQEAELLQAQMRLEERKLAVDQLGREAEKKELEFLNGLGDFLNSPKSQAVLGLSKEAADTFKAIDQQYQTANRVP